MPKNAQKSPLDSFDPPLPIAPQKTPAAPVKNRQKPLIDLLPYQKKWMHDDSRFKAGMLCRQSGKTFVGAAEAIDDCILAEMEGRITRWIILSRGERQALDVMRDKIIPMARAFMTLYNAKLGFDIIDADFTTHGNNWRFAKSELVFPGGSRITAIPALGDTARGASGNLLLDEFAFHDNSYELWGAIYPIISSNPLFKVRVISTPNGKNNKFYDIMTGDNEAAIWSRHSIDIYQAIAQGLKRDIDELKAGMGDEDMFAQEFELDWRDEAKTWLPYEIIIPMENDTAGNPEYYKNGNICYVGVDIARHHDLFVITVIEQTGLQCYEVREVFAKKGLSYAEQDAALKRVMQQYKVVRCFIDATGLGNRSAEEAITQYGTRVEAIIFTQKSKYDMAVAFKRYLQGRMLTIPKLRDYREDLHSVTQHISESGATKFKAARKSGSHADRFWSAALACLAATQNTTPFALHSNSRINSTLGYGIA